MLGVRELKNSKILLVDDQPANLKILTTFLQDFGASLHVALNGESAISNAEKGQPDLILLDIMMPGIDGFETCRRLKQSEMTRDIPVIFMSALNDSVDKLTGFESGGVDYITKPLNHAEVIARVRAHLIIRHQQHELKTKNEELNFLNASKDRFFSIIAHDLKNPFASMMILADLLEQTSPPGNEKHLSLIGDLRQVVRRSHNLLENLLHWARVQQGMMPFSPNDLDFYEIVRETVALLDEMAKQKDIKVVHAIQPNTFLFGDADMIATVLRNLLTNAIKFTETGGEVSILIEADETPNYQRIAVRDNGVGLTEKAKASLFKIDQKYQTSGTAREQGTGLGLILCRELVEKHGGKIWAESEQGQGSTFYFTVPQTLDIIGNKMSDTSLV